MQKLPFIQFYPGDWLKDPAVGLCSPATRGIWMDAICAMHEQGQTGELSGNAASLARVCRCTPEEISCAAQELRATQTADVTICNDKITLINRRMRRLHELRKSAKERQFRHRHKTGNEIVTEKSRLLSSSSSSYKQQPNHSKLKADGNPGNGAASLLVKLGLPEDHSFGAALESAGVTSRHVVAMWAQRRQEAKNPDRPGRLLAKILVDDGASAAPELTSKQVVEAVKAGLVSAIHVGDERVEVAGCKVQYNASGLIVDGSLAVKAGDFGRAEFE
jgi:hypothetical protein